MTTKLTVIPRVAAKHFCWIGLLLGASFSMAAAASEPFSIQSRFGDDFRETLWMAHRWDRSHYADRYPFYRSHWVRPYRPFAYPPYAHHHRYYADPLPAPKSGPAIGTRLDMLPPGYNSVDINGTLYFESEGVWYQWLTESRLYEVIERP